jgi:aerobic-type carbon monoxide dehydrogenase small subunit (CoxS/CutS family)
LKIAIDMTVNGEVQQLEVESSSTLLEVLRDTLHLTGTKEGCGLGDCGTCIVLVDGNPVNSCLMLAADAQGCHVTTIEGLANNDQLDPLQQSFIDRGAVQCGFCTPGMILSAKGLLDKKPHANTEEIKLALSGVLCRCGTYKKVIEAVEAVAGRRKDGL